MYKLFKIKNVLVIVEKKIKPLFNFLNSKILSKILFFLITLSITSFILSFKNVSVIDYKYKFLFNIFLYNNFF